MHSHSDQAEAPAVPLVVLPDHRQGRLGPTPRVRQGLAEAQQGISVAVRQAVLAVPALLADQRAVLVV